MSKAVVAFPGSPDEVVNLKDPTVAAILAWLVPGLGHLYQGRTAKGVLFMVCILSTFFFGLYLSDGHAVYASWTADDTRLYYLGQVCVGLPALPALVQTYRVRSGQSPLVNGLMAPPVDGAQLSEWYRTLHSFFELGTVYTMIAGLLNVLAIYDAWGGPVPLEVMDEKKPRPDKAAPSPG